MKDIPLCLLKMVTKDSHSTFPMQESVITHTSTIHFLATPRYHHDVRRLVHYNMYWLHVLYGQVLAIAVKIAHKYHAQSRQICNFEGQYTQHTPTLFPFTLKELHQRLYHLRQLKCSFHMNVIRGFLVEASFNAGCS